MRPKIIHPVKVILHGRKETEIDREFGITGKIEWHDPVEIYGHVMYEKFEHLMPVGEGNDPVDSGHVVFYIEDWLKSYGAVGDDLELEESSMNLRAAGNIALYPSRLFM